MRSLLATLATPRPASGLVVFRMMFGALMAVSAVRFMLNGWVERFFGERTFFFKYWGFSFVEPGPVWAMYGVYTAIAVLSLCVALGLFYRVAIVLFFVLFSYAELTDVTNYLNHYYLVSLLALLMSFMPLSAKWSLDAWRNPSLARETLPAWMSWLLRFQVGTVYVGAALAKVGVDWLVHGQPLNAWLSSHADLPLIGPYLQWPEVALLAGWGGFLHDLLVVPLLLWPRTRVIAYSLLASFHLMTSTWFNIGIFPVLMPMAATLFFAPDWPERAWERAREMAVRTSTRTRTRTRTETGTKTTTTTTTATSTSTSTSERLPGWGVVLIGGYCVFQVLMPFRTHLYGGNVTWHEQGMRWSWRVMLRTKYGSIMYRVTLPDGREVRVPPRKYLSTDQEREMSGQPDLILQLAHHIADDLREKGHGNVQVRVDALVSLNGREPVPLIDPDVDLARIEDGLGLAAWITPAPSGPPIRLSPSKAYASAAP